jgi:hypothetical protein
MEQEHAPSPVTVSDLALLRTVRVCRGEVAPGFWDAFRSDWRASLKWAWESVRLEDPQAARETLRIEHAAQARPDLARIHSSWWTRALHAEPSSVRRCVAANLPEGIAAALRDDLELAAHELEPDRPAQPVALRTALALWTVRLVGDLPERSDDPPVITALTQLDAGALARLIRTAGLAKWALTIRPAPATDPKDAERLEHFRTVLDGIDPRFRPVAERDIAGLDPADPQPAARAGLTSFARLLNVADPYRARWALQHLPYSTSRSLRALIGPIGRRTPMLARWESEILRAAWQALHEEGRVPFAWGTAP